MKIKDQRKLYDILDGLLRAKNSIAHYEEQIKTNMRLIEKHKKDLAIYEKRLEDYKS